MREKKKKRRGEKEKKGGKIEEFKGIFQGKGGRAKQRN